MKREKALILLAKTINKNHGSHLKPDQVEMWVGSDTSADSIMREYYEVENSKGKEGLTPSEVLEMCEAM